MNELLKQSASDFNKKLDKRVEDDGFTYLYEGRDVIDSQEVLDWHTQQMQLAYEKGRESIIDIVHTLPTVDIKDQSGRMVKEQLISKDSLLDKIK